MLHTVLYSYIVEYRKKQRIKQLSIEQTNFWLQLFAWLVEGDQRFLLRCRQDKVWRKTKVNINLEFYVYYLQHNMLYELFSKLRTEDEVKIENIN